MMIDKEPDLAGWFLGAPEPYQMMTDLQRAFSTGRPWQATWLSSIDSLDVGFLLEWPDVCRYLVFNCALCGARPPCLLDHLRVHHAEWTAAAEQLTEEMMQQFMMRAKPGRICSCHPYHVRNEPIDEHVCPCMLNFGMLNRFLRAAQAVRARDCGFQLALQLERSFN